VKTETCGKCGCAFSWDNNALFGNSPDTEWFSYICPECSREKAAQARHEEHEREAERRHRERTELEYERRDREQMEFDRNAESSRRREELEESAREQELEEQREQRKHATEMNRVWVVAGATMSLNSIDDCLARGFFTEANNQLSGLTNVLARANDPALKARYWRTCLTLADRAGIILLKEKTLADLRVAFDCYDESDFERSYSKWNDQMSGVSPELNIFIQYGGSKTVVNEIRKKFDLRIASIREAARLREQAKIQAAEWGAAIQNLSTFDEKFERLSNCVDQLIQAEHYDIAESLVSSQVRIDKPRSRLDRTRLLALCEKYEFGSLVSLLQEEIHSENAGTQKALRNLLIFAAIGVLGVFSYIESGNRKEPGVQVSTPPAAQAVQEKIQQVQVTLTNNDCNAADIYVADSLVLTIPSGSARLLTVDAGVHIVKACVSGSTSCGDPVTVNWPSGTANHQIFRNDACNVGAPPPPIESLNVTVSNRDCHQTDFYVSNQLRTSIQAESTAVFSIEPGNYDVSACISGTSDCGSSVSVNWMNGDQSHEIYRGASCN